MKRFPELARRGVALALAASMSLSVFMPGALAADLTTADVHDHDHVQLAAENSVDELGNEDLSDETDTVPDETAAKPVVVDTPTSETLEDADHTWGEWQKDVYQDEDGNVRDAEYRICSDCGILELDDGTLLTPSMGSDLDIIDPDEPEWLLPETEPSGIATYHSGGHEFNTAWNAGSGDVQYNAGNYRPTCTKTGWGWCRCTKTWRIGKIWGRCDYWENHTINMAPHTWPQDGTVEQASPCVDGWKVWRCTVCGTELKREKIDAKPHVYGDPITVEPTCEVGGKTYKKCSVCGYEDVLETTDPLGHHTDGQKWTVGDGSDVGWVVDQPYKCVDGTKTRTCDAGDETETLPVKASEDHKWVKDETKSIEPTCTEEGTYYYYCSECGDTSRSEPIPATGHHTGGTTDEFKWTVGDGSDVGWVVNQPHKCVDGTKTRTCDAGDETETLPVKATEKHKWVKDETKSIEPTCTEEGTYYYTCSECGGEKSDTIPANGHSRPEDTSKDENWIILTPATCTTAGQRALKCTVCGKAIPGTEEEIKELGHEWDKGTIDQKYPCVDGTITYKCTRDGCNGTKTETYKATADHKYEFVSTTQKYPCQPGKETWKCSVCGATEERDAKVADHSFGLWTDDDVLGCQTQKQTRTCLVCGYQEHRTSGGPVRGHKYTKYVMKTSTEWATVNIPVDVPSWAVGTLKKLGVRFDDENKHIQIADNMPVPIVVAYCDYGCGAYDKLIATEFPEYAAEAWAATEASKSVANTAEPLIREALADTKTAVNNAQSREEAIASLDQIYAVAKAKLLANGSVPVKVDLRATGTWPSSWPVLGGKQWTVKLYEGTINVPITEEVVDQALAQLKNVLDDTKNMLNNSFLSEDAIKVAINKIVDTVAADSGLNESIRQLVFYPIYNSINTRKQEQWPNQATDSTPTETGELILRLAESAVTDKDGWQPFLDAIFDDLIDMLIEQLKKDPEYSKYLDNALGDELLEELRPKLREELVNDTTFVDTIRKVAGDAISNAAYGVKRGWSDQRVLDQLREDLLKVQDPVEQEMLDLSATIGDLVESSLTEKINKLLPFGDLTSWIGKWVGAFAKDKAVSEVVGETGKVRSTIEMYIKYITCGQHHHVYENIAATCTEPAYTIDSCDKCGWRFSKTKTGEALGHTPVTVKGYDATETTDGLTDGIQCSVCGKWIEPQEVIPAQEPQYDKWLVKAAVTADTVKATGYKEQKKLDEAINAALTKAGYEPANSERFLAQVQTSIGILSNDRYPEDGVTGMVKIPAGAAGKNCTFYAVQVLTADTHGYSAGDVVITPLTVTDEGISLKVPVQSVVAIAWKVNE